MQAWFDLVLASLPIISRPLTTLLRGIFWPVPVPKKQIGRFLSSWHLCVFGFDTTYIHLSHSRLSHFGGLWDVCMVMEQQCGMGSLLATVSSQCLEVSAGKCRVCGISQHQIPLGSQFWSKKHWMGNFMKWWLLPMQAQTQRGGAYDPKFKLDGTKPVWLFYVIELSSESKCLILWLFCGK